MIKIPNYEIGRLAGKGGVAEVYLAKHKLLDRSVAIKIISPTQTDEVVDKRFLKEAKVVAGLHHENIVSIYDVGIISNKYYIIMEYLEGGDLKQLVKRGLSVSQSVTILKQIASALAHAHEKGFIHRDIKSHNIMFRSDQTAVLTDFGIVKDLTADAGYTLDGTSIGTPHYMSPEQAQGSAAIDWRTDLYSLGVTFYEMLTGSVPYNADSAIAVALKHIKDPVPQLPEHLSRFQPIIDKLMAKKPDKRYQSAKDLIAAIEAFEGKDRPTNEFTQPMEFGWKTKPVRIFFPLSLITIFLVLVLFNWNYLTSLVDQFQTIPKLKIPKIKLVMPSDETKPPPGPESSTNKKTKTEPDMATGRQTQQVLAGEDLLASAIAGKNYTDALNDIAKLRDQIHDSPGEMLRNADNLLADKKFMEAAANYHTILSQDPKNRPAMLGLLYAAIEKKQDLKTQKEPSIGEYDLLLSLLNKGMDSNRPSYFNQLKSDTGESVYEQANKLFQDQQLKQAGQWTETGLEFAPDNLKLKLLNYRILAKISLDDNRLTLPDKDNALAYYRHILDMAPNDADAKKGIELIVEKYKSMAMSAQKDKNYKDAASFIKRAREIDPDNQELKKIEWLVSGDEASGKASAQYYVKAYKLDPANPTIREKIENAIKDLRESGDTKEAKTLLVQAMQIDPNNSKYDDMLQSINLFEKEKDKIYNSLNNIKQAQSFNDKIDLYRALLIDLNLASEKFDQKKISGMKRAAVEQVKDDIRILEAQNQLIPAGFTDLVKTNFPELNEYINDAQYDMLIKNGDKTASPTQAAGYYLEAFKLDPKKTSARDKMVSVIMNLLQIGMKDEALSILNRAAKIAPDNIQFNELIQRYSSFMKVSVTDSGCTDNKIIILNAPVTAENLNLCIQYKNLTPDTLVNVILENNGGHLMEIPVVLNGLSGNKSVSISAPVEGFSLGKYKIALKQNGKTVSQTFIQFISKRR